MAARHPVLNDPDWPEIEAKLLGADLGLQTCENDLTASFEDEEGQFRVFVHPLKVEDREDPSLARFMVEGGGHILYRGESLRELARWLEGRGFHAGL